MDSIATTSAIEARDQALPTHVRQAITFLRENMREKVTLAELASVCALPERTLLRQFQKFVGLAPLAYLRRLRLNAVRSALTQPANAIAISDIAIRYGFSHLGRFAAEYRRQFNETPSATRQRARAPARDTAQHSVVSASAWSCGPDRPSLLILPLCTETLQESLEARALSERLAADLSRMRVASVTLAQPSHRVATNVLHPRNAGAVCWAD